MANHDVPQSVLSFVRDNDLMAEYTSWLKDYDIESEDDFIDVLDAEGKDGLKDRFESRISQYGEIENDSQPEINAKIKNDIRTRIRNYVEDHPNVSRVVFKAEDPMDLKEATLLSRTFTNEFDMPIYVYSNAKKTDHTGLKTGKYTEATVQVTMSMSEGDDTRGKFQLYKAYRSKGGQKLKVGFVTDQKPKNYSTDQDLSKNFEKYLYLATKGDKEILLMSDSKLEVGREYTVTGYCFDTYKFDELNVNLTSLQSTFLSFHEEPAMKGQSISDDILERCGKYGRQYVIDSVVYPWHHAIQDYKELWSANFYSLDTGFPFNLMVIGEPTLGKTTVLDKIEAVTGEPAASGSGTLKGLIASFSTHHLSAGHLAESRDKALVNEFFEILANTPSETRNQYLSPMKEMLEGKEAYIRSGNGNIRTTMNADFCAVSNPPRKPGGDLFNNVVEMYDTFDTAWLDRMLFYWIPEEEQRKKVEEYEDWADQKMEEADGEYSQLDFKDEHDECLDCDRYLDTNELYEILRYARSADRNVRAPQVLKQAKDTLREQHIPNVVKGSKLRKHLLNVATGQAMMRYLANGELPENNTVQVQAEDIRHAEDLMKRVFETYTGGDVGSRRAKVYELAGEPFEVYSTLKQWWMDNEEKYAKKLTVDELREKVDIDDIDAALDTLVERELVVRAGDEVMWMPNLSTKVRQGLSLIKDGEEISQEQNWVFKKLSNAGLVSYDEDRGQYYLWDDDIADASQETAGRSTQSVEEQILEMAEEPIDYEDVIEAIDADDEYVEEVIEDMLSGGDLFEPVSGKVKRL